MIGAGTPRELKNRLALLVFVLECLTNSLLSNAFPGDSWQ
jgi:hypothetical protein